jgi:hypothetical protein
VRIRKTHAIKFVPFLLTKPVVVSWDLEKNPSAIAPLGKARFACVELKSASVDLTMRQEVNASSVATPKRR